MLQAVEEITTSRRGAILGVLASTIAAAPAAAQSHPDAAMMAAADRFLALQRQIDEILAADFDETESQPRIDELDDAAFVHADFVLAHPAKTREGLVVMAQVADCFYPLDEAEDRLDFGRRLQNAILRAVAEGRA